MGDNHAGCNESAGYARGDSGRPATILCSWDSVPIHFRFPGAPRLALLKSGRGRLGKSTALRRCGSDSRFKAYKLASRDVKEEDTVVRFSGTNAAIGGRNLAVVAGPCSIESREQAFAIAGHVAAAGAQFWRRRLQAAHFSVCFSGTRPRRAEDHGQRQVRPVHCDRSTGCRDARTGG